jgi:hypothetical protein
MTYVLRIWSDPASMGRLAIRLTLLAIRRIAGAPSLAAFAADTDRGAKIAGASNGTHGVRQDQILEQPASDDVHLLCVYRWCCGQGNRLQQSPWTFISRDVQFQWLSVRTRRRFGRFDNQMISAIADKVSPKVAALFRSTCDFVTQVASFMIAAELAQ